MIFKIITMLDDKFCLVVGTFFQEKGTLNGPTVFNTMFLGVLDFNQKVGVFQDCYGDSDIEILSVSEKENVVKLTFIKTYKKQLNNSICYEVFSKHNPENDLMEWVGTWKISNAFRDYGSVRLNTIKSNYNVSDYKITNELLQQFIPEENLPF